MGSQRYSQMQRLAFRARALSLAVLSLLFIAGNSGAQESTVKRFGYRIVSIQGFVVFFFHFFRGFA